MSAEVLSTKTMDNCAAAAVDIETGRQLDAVLLPAWEAPGHQDRLATIGLMSAGIAHDLGNLIQVIDSGLRCVERHFDANSPPELQALVGEIRGAAARAGALTSRVLDHACGAAQPPQATDLGAHLLQMRPMLGWAAGPMVRLSLDVQSEVSAVRCIRSGLESAVINLVVNARHAMPEGGDLVVALRQCGEAVLLLVADSGCGMSAEAARRACEPFVSSRKGKGGSGLGLAIVRAFMEEVGGAMTFESALGQGTSVLLSFPVAS